LLATEGPLLGPNVVQAPLENVLASMEAIPERLDWPWVRERVLPVMPRLRPWMSGTPRTVQAVVGPGIVVGFGIDVGPAFLSVSRDLMVDWPVSVADLTAAALVNLHARATLVEPADVYHGSVADVPTEWLQTGRSIGSALVLAPSELRRLLGAQARLIIAPMRDLLIAMPATADPELAAWLFAQIAVEDPNCLVPVAYEWDGSAVTAVPLSLDPGPGSDRPHGHIHA
jgi:hypothetical protein